jgi:hypothetical protein
MATSRQQLGAGASCHGAGSGPDSRRLPRFMATRDPDPDPDRAAAPWRPAARATRRPGQPWRGLPGGENGGAAPVDGRRCQSPQSPPVLLPFTTRSPPVLLHGIMIGRARRRPGAISSPTTIWVEVSRAGGPPSLHVLAVARRAAQTGRRPRPWRPQPAPMAGRPLRSRRPGPSEVAAHSPLASVASPAAPSSSVVPAGATPQVRAHPAGFSSLGRHGTFSPPAPGHLPGVGEPARSRAAETAAARRSSAHPAGLAGPARATPIAPAGGRLSDSGSPVDIRVTVWPAREAGASPTRTERRCGRNAGGRLVPRGLLPGDRGARGPRAAARRDAAGRLVSPPTLFDLLVDLVAPRKRASFRRRLALSHAPCARSLVRTKVPARRSLAADSA